MKNFLIIILMIGIILGTGYGVYYEIEMKKKEWEQSETTEELVDMKEEIAIDAELVTSLMEKIHYLNDGLLWRNAEVEESPYFGYWYQKDIISRSEISNQVKLYLALRSLYSDDWHKEDTVKVSKEEVEHALEKIFGEKNIIHESLKGENQCNYTNFTYDEQTETYQQDPLFCGVILPAHYIAQIEKATKYSDRIEIIETVAYIDFTGVDNGEILNVYKTNKEKVVSLEDIDNEQDILKQYQNKLDTYQYTFQFQNGNYYLNSIEKKN